MINTQEVDAGTLKLALTPTLYALAVVSEKLGKWDNVLELTEEHQATSPTIESLSLQAKAMIMQQPAKAEHFIMKLLRDSQCTVEAGLEICELLSGQPGGNQTLLHNAYSALQQRFPTHTEITISQTRSMFDQHRVEDA